MWPSPEGHLVSRHFVAGPHFQPGSGRRQVRPARRAASPRRQQNPALTGFCLIQNLQFAIPIPLFTSIRILATNREKRPIINGTGNSACLCFGMSDRTQARCHHQCRHERPGNSVEMRQLKTTNPTSAQNQQNYSHLHATNSFIMPLFWRIHRFVARQGRTSLVAARTRSKCQDHVVAATSYFMEIPEPAFRNFNSKNLLPSPADRQALAHLSARVAADAGDLLSHTQRILLSLRLNDAEHAFGALVDLFTATGSKALSLRKGLLARCKNLISLEQSSLLETNLISGLSATTAPASAQSVLSKGLISQICAVRRAP